MYFASGFILSTEQKNVTFIPGLIGPDGDRQILTSSSSGKTTIESENHALFNLEAL